MLTITPLRAAALGASWFAGLALLAGCANPDVVRYQQGMAELQRQCVAGNAGACHVYQVNRQHEDAWNSLGTGGYYVAPRPLYLNQGGSPWYNPPRQIIR